MIFDQPLEQATFLRRYKRFMVDVERADGSLFLVHALVSHGIRHGRHTETVVADVALAFCVVV